MNKIDTLCVIDDDDIYTYTVKRLVKTTGLAQKTIFFENGKTAIDFFNENKYNTDELPDLIFLDLNMPVLDGWQFMDQFLKLIEEPRLLNRYQTLLLSPLMPKFLNRSFYSYSLCLH